MMSRKIFGVLDPLPPCPQLGFIYSIKFTQPPFVCLLLSQPHPPPNKRPLWMVPNSNYDGGWKSFMPFMDGPLQVPSRHDDRLVRLTASFSTSFFDLRIFSSGRNIFKFILCSKLHLMEIAYQQLGSLIGYIWCSLASKTAK